MATLHKFKLLATQCAIAGSPSRSPTTSPVFQIRRRKTLRMFLIRGGSGRRKTESPPSSSSVPPEDRKSLLSNKLKDLFVSSPPLEDNGRSTDKINGVEVEAEEFTRISTVRTGRTAGSHRPLSAAFRYRLLRRPWRPMLGSIPE